MCKHGRLIDADVLLTILEHEREYHEKNGLQIRADGVIDAIMDVIDAPTIEPERKTGKWIDTGSGQECSVCGEIQYGYDNFRRFCGNCGARMSGGESCN